MRHAHPDPLKIIQKLIKERYRAAKSVFWGGSVSQNQGTEASDLDTLRYFTEKLEAGDGRPALINIILNGQEVWGQSQINKKTFPDHRHLL